MKKFVYKIKKKLSDGSIDSEHYIALFYCVIIMLPMLITLIEVLILEKSSSTFSKLLKMLCFIVVNGLFFRYYIKKMISYFKYKRFMLGFLSSSLVVSFLLLILSWLSIFFGNISNLINKHLLLVNQPMLLNLGESIISSIESIQMISQIMLFFSQVIGISMLLNVIMPKSLQKVDVPLMKKFLRLMFKIAILLVFGVAIFTFLNTNKDNFIVVSIAYAGIIWVSDPKNFITIFFNAKIFENKTISDEATRAYKIFRYFVIGLYAIWAASVYIFPENKANAFSAMVFIFIFASVIIKTVLQFKGEDIFSKLLKDKESETKVERDFE